MKNLLLILLVTSFAFAGAIQKEEPKKTNAKKTTASKRSPTPAKKSPTTAKTSTTKKKPSSQTSSATTKGKDKKTAASNVKARPKPSAARSGPKPTATKNDDKGDLEKALADMDPEKKLTALTKFLADYPKSSLRPRALESLTAVRIALGDANIEAGDPQYGLKLIREALRDAPVPYPEKLFVEIISKVPSTLSLRGQRAAAIEAALAIEKNSASNLSQLLTLADFYLSTENGDAATRLAEAAIKLDEKSVAAYQTLGMAHRLNFDLDASEATFAKALEIDAESVSARRSLADMKRALGKSDEALSLYAEVLTKDPDDLMAQTGRILSLFESGKRSEAELELSRAIEADKANVILLAGAAWWYVSSGETAKAIDLAGKAFAAEPRYIWSHIALARAYLAEGRLADAERTLLGAKKYGNFPTLEYELATVRFANGLFREAVDELRKSFSVRDGMVFTKLGRRIERSDKSFPDLLANERRASILLPKSADNADVAERMKTLLEFNSLLAETKPDRARAADLAEAFAKGSDRMRYHRQIYAANALLEKRIAPTKALELSRMAVSGVDDGLAISSPSAPIMANELYPSRSVSVAAGQYVAIPDVPKHTLSSIARGRIEEIAGWSLMEQGSHAEAVVRLRRAVSILPEKSAWWRSSLWRLGAAFEADGKDKEALEAYVKGYPASEPDAGKYAAIATVFRRVNGSTDGLETLIGADPSRPAEKAADVAKTAETKETGAPPTEVKSEISGTAAKVEDRTADQKKVPERMPEVPASVPVQATKTDAPSVDQKSVEVVKKAEPAPVEEKPVESIEKRDAAPSEEKPVEKNEPPAPVSKIEEKQSEPKILPDKGTETPTSVETPKKVEDKPVAGDEALPSVANVRQKVDEPKPPPEKKTEKALFEPVVIEVKSSSKPDKPADRAIEPEDRTVAGRARVVEGQSPSRKAPPPCSVTVSQENVSLAADGGSIGVLVDVNGEVDLKLLAAAANSPKDLEVTRQPEIAGVSGRAYFVIKSLTNAAGEYTITFAAPCGKKEVNVKVR